MAKPFISSDAKRPCHERAIHSSLDRSPVDNHGQHHNGRDLRRSPFPKVTILPDLALQAGSRWSRLGSALPCPAGRSVPGRGGPERRRRPRPDGTGPDAHEIAHGTGRDTLG
jgi:hypothetical protein